MSRIGRMPIAIPAGVTVEIAENNNVTVKGPKGTLVRALAPDAAVVSREDEETDGHWRISLLQTVVIAKVFIPCPSIL